MGWYGFIDKICMEPGIDVGITKVGITSWDYTLTGTDMESIEFGYGFYWYFWLGCN